MSRGLPGPAGRISRKPLSLLGTLLLTGLAVAAGFTSSSAEVQLQGKVDANFHGAYDILVRPAGSRLNLEQTRGLVEANFLGLTGKGGISLAQLSAIRRLPDVNLAAPVSVVGFLRTDAVGVALFTSRLPKRPTLYELSLRASTSDGITSIPLQAQTGRVLLGPVDPRHPETLARLATDLEDVSSGSDGTYVSFPALPAIESPLIGVDPVAEQELLGPTAAFLRRLTSIGGGSFRTAGGFDQRKIPAEFAVTATQLGALAGANATTRTRPVVPILVSDRLYSDLRITLDITQLGSPLTRFPDPNASGGVEVAAAMAGPGRTPVGEVSLNAGPRLRPYAPPSLVLLWPGSGRPNGVAAYPFPARVFAARVPARPTYSAVTPRPGSTALSFRVVPRGPVTSDGQPAPVGGPLTQPHPGNQLPLAAGRQQSYRTAATYPVDVARDFSPSLPGVDRPFLLAPVGTFDLGTLKLPSNPVDYVPLGAYDLPGSDLVARPGGTALQHPRALEPSLNPLGLLTGPPLAITDLVGAATLRGAAPVDAIRVRVANVTGFHPDTQRRLEQVASRIADMGLEADIVAGSSPGRVEIFVPRYYVDLHNQDLGWVAQKWTTLGAAQRVVRGFGAANLLMLSLAVGIAILFAAAQQIIEGSARSREISILSALGWSRLRILGWLQGEAVITAVVMLLGGTAVGSLTGHLGLGIVMALLLAAAYALASVAVAPLAWRRVSPGAVQAGDVHPASWLPRMGEVVGPISYGRRAALARPVRSAGVIASLALGASSLVLVGVAGLPLVADQAGTTLLAGAVGSSLRGYQLALLALSAAAALLLAAVILRLTASGQAHERVVLAAAGWSSRALRRIDLSHRAHLGAAAAVAAALVTALADRVVLAGHWQVPVILAALVAGALVLPGSGRGLRSRR